MEQEQPKPVPAVTQPPTLPPKNMGGKNKRWANILLVIILILLAAGGAWYYQQQEINRLRGSTESVGEQKDDKAATSKGHTIILGPAGFDAGDEEYIEAGATLVVLDGWTTKYCQGGSDGSVFAYIAKTSDDQVICDTDSPGQIVVSLDQHDGELDEFDTLSTDAYTDREEETVTIAGIEFTRITAKTSDQHEFWQAGSTLVVYLGVKDNVVYTLQYFRSVGDVDLTKDFDAIAKSLELITE